MTHLTQSQLNERSDDVGRNSSDNETLGDIIAARFGRRDFLRGGLGVAAIAATVSRSHSWPPARRAPT